MERSIIPEASVFNQLKDDFVLTSQYTDHQTDAAPALLLQKYSPEEFAVPLYIVVDNKGNEIARLTPPTNITSLTAADFAKFLEDAKRKYAQTQ